MSPGAPLTRLRKVITAAVTALMAAIGYPSIVIGYFVTYPACASVQPPGPPSFWLWALVTTVVCGATPVAVVGRQDRRRAALVFALAAIVPLGCAIYVASRVGEGFCL